MRGGEGFRNCAPISVMRPSMLLRNNASDLFKKAMARIGSPAMVMTCASDTVSSSSLAQELANLAKHFHGATLSSVTLLSVSPRPLLLFNVHLPSFASDELHKKDYLAVHILPPTPRLATLGRAFACGLKLARKDDQVSGRTLPFEGLVPEKDWYLHKINDSISVPILREAECALVCQTVRSIYIDNHEIWTATVLNVLEHDGSDSNKGGLLYFNRAFHRVGPAVVNQEA